MSDTEQLFIVAAVWAAVSALIARFVPNWPGRVALFAILVGVPFWELPYGYYNFQRLCRDEISLAVESAIAPQDTVCVDDLYSDVYAMLTEVGFTRVEYRGRTNVRRGGLAGPELVPVQRGNEKSKYCLNAVNNIQLPWRVLRHDYLIVRANDSRSVARQSRYSWAGLWWQQMSQPLVGGGGSCGRPMRNVLAAIRHGAE